MRRSSELLDYVCLTKNIYKARHLITVKYIKYIIREGKAKANNYHRRDKARHWGVSMCAWMCLCLGPEREAGVRVE